MLSVVSSPAQLLNPAQTDVMPCEYLSLDSLERWIILGYALCPQVRVSKMNLLIKIGAKDFITFDFHIQQIYFFQFSFHKALQKPQAMEVWSGALQTGWVIPLFRDEVLHPHSFIQAFLETKKEFSKRVSDVKDAYAHSVSHA